MANGKARPANSPAIQCVICRVVDIQREIEACVRSLPEVEVDRAQKLRHPRRRREWLLSRWLLRKCLAEAVGVAAKDLVIAQTSNGKPYLESGGPSCVFNVSHSAQWIALVIAKGDTVGIDAEDTQRKNDFMSIAERYFSVAERRQLRQAEDQRAHFFRLWTLKEAYIKAVGTRLNPITLHESEFHVEKGVIKPLFSPSPSNWHFRNALFEDSLMLSIAVSVPGVSVLIETRRQLTPRKSEPLALQWV